MGGLQIRTWGFTHQLFKQTSSKDGRGHGQGPATLGPPGDLCFSHRLGWLLSAPGPPLGHPWATLPVAPMAPFVFLSCCFMVSAENQMLVASVTQGERVIQEGSGPLWTTRKAQESVCGPCPPGGRTPPYVSHLERPGHAPSLGESSISMGWWRARSHV